MQHNLIYILFHDKNILLKMRQWNFFLTFLVKSNFDKYIRRIIENLWFLNTQAHKMDLYWNYNETQSAMTLSIKQMPKFESLLLKLHVASVWVKESRDDVYQLTVYLCLLAGKRHVPHIKTLQNMNINICPFTRSAKCLT